jgi:TonB family protein
MREWLWLNTAMKQADKIPVSIAEWSGPYTGRIIPFIGISVAFHALFIVMLVAFLIPNPNAGGGSGSDAAGSSADPGHREIAAQGTPIVAGFGAPVRNKVFPIDYFREVIQWSPSSINVEVPAMPAPESRIYLAGNVPDLNAAENEIPATVVPVDNPIETGNDVHDAVNLMANGNSSGGSGDGAGGNGEGTGGLGEGNGGNGNGSDGFGTGTGENEGINSIERTGNRVPEEIPESELTGGNQTEIIAPDNEIDIESLLARYIETIKIAVRNAKSYPQMSQRLRETGSTQINFTVASNGELTSASITESSGYDRLDQAAIDAVRAAAPFDPIPPDSGLETVSMSITLIFELN